MHNKDYLQRAAITVFEESAALPLGFGVPVDPDVADFMGALGSAQESFSEDMCDDDYRLEVNAQGDVVYGG